MPFFSFPHSFQFNSVRCCDLQALPNLASAHFCALPQRDELDAYSYGPDFPCCSEFLIHSTKLLRLSFSAWVPGPHYWQSDLLMAATAARHTRRAGPLVIELPRIWDDAMAQATMRMWSGLNALVVGDLGGVTVVGCSKEDGKPEGGADEAAAPV